MPPLSAWYCSVRIPIWRTLEMAVEVFPLRTMPLNTGNASAAKTAMMAIVISSSTSVNPGAAAERRSDAEEGMA